MENKINSMINKIAYNSPDIYCKELKVEGSMAVNSGTTEWYKQGGQGNFTYTVEDDTNTSWK